MVIIFFTSDLNLQFTIFNIPVQKLKVVDNLIFTAEIGIFVFKDVETMWANGYYFFYFIHPEYLNNLKRLYLVKHFVAGTPCRIAVARFFLPKYGITYIQMREDFCKCPYYFFVPVIESSGTANPKKVLRLLSSGKKVCHYRDFNFPGFHFFSFLLILLVTQSDTEKTQRATEVNEYLVPDLLPTASCLLLNIATGHRYFLYY